MFCLQGKESMYCFVFVWGKEACSSFAVVAAVVVAAAAAAAILLSFFLPQML